MDISIFVAAAAAILTGLLLTLLMPIFMLEWVALVPAHVGLVTFRPWTVLTQVVAETNPFAAVANIAIALAVGRKVESERSSASVVTILLIATVSSSLAFILEAVVAFAMGRYTLFQCYYGGLPLSLAVSVAAWQQNPAQLVGTVLPIGMLPTLVLGGSATVDIIYRSPAPTEVEISSGNPFPASSTLPSVIAFICVWIYLRQFENRTGVPGDPAPHFAFHRMFPMPLRVLVLAVTTVLSPLGRLLGFRIVYEEASGRSGDDNATGGEDALQKIMVTTKSDDTTIAPLPDSSSLMADKRRQIALAALQSRLHQVEAAHAPGPSAHSRAVDVDEETVPSFDTDVA